jgi:hypothetical protein
LIEDPEERLPEIEEIDEDDDSFDEEIAEILVNVSVEESEDIDIE